MVVPEGLLYTAEHEWARAEGNLVRVGITEYAQSELGDVVFADLPEIGAQAEKGQSIANVESVKAVSDIYAPVSGKVVEINQKLSDQPELINSEPYTDGWMLVIEVETAADLKSLMDAKSYQNHLEEISK